MKVLDYILRSSNGRIIRTATKVILDDGKEIKFTEKMSHKKALAQAKEIFSKEVA